MWPLTDEPQITGLARASRSLRAPCAPISPVFLSSAAWQKPLEAPPSSPSPGLWRGSCLLTGGVSGDEPRCKHSVSLTEVCWVGGQFFCCPLPAAAPRRRLIECGAVLTPECRPLCLPNKGSLSAIDGRIFFSSFFFSLPLLWRCERGSDGCEMFHSNPRVLPFSFLKEHLVQSRRLILI